MAEFTAQDVKKLRDATGAGMMDAKRALTENDGDFTAASKWLREKGLGKAAERADRENAQGAVEVAREGQVAAIVQLKCETDFVAKNADFVNLAGDLAELVAKNGEEAVNERQDDLDNLRITLKENIELGQVARLEAQGENQVLDTYVHRQDGRGVNAVAVILENGSDELAHDIAVHIAFGKPKYLSRDDIPKDVLDEERKTLENVARNTGKPEAALPKIAEGMLNGWVKERVLLEQPYAKDDKQSVQQVLGGARVVRFAQVVIG
ncbi:MAG: elongation factor Ts [Actinomycetota bacterium]|jgi:elongation factor Ts|nr:elongation factor Ts [Actinomycetota bacterium]